jgi:hypothetical protein
MKTKTLKFGQGKILIGMDLKAKTLSLQESTLKREVGSASFKTDTKGVKHTTKLKFNSNESIDILVEQLLLLKEYGE